MCSPLEPSRCDKRPLPGLYTGPVDPLALINDIFVIHQHFNFDGGSFTWHSSSINAYWGGSLITLRDFFLRLLRLVFRVKSASVIIDSSGVRRT